MVIGRAADLSGIAPLRFLQRLLSWHVDYNVIQLWDVLFIHIDQIYVPRGSIRDVWEKFDGKFLITKSLQYISLSQFSFILWFDNDRFLAKSYLFAAHLLARMTKISFAICKWMLFFFSIRVLWIFNLINTRDSNIFNYARLFLFMRWWCLSFCIFSHSFFTWKIFTLL